MEREHEKSRCTDLIKTSKIRGQSQAKVLYPYTSPSTARSASKGTSMRQTQDPRKQGLVTQELFCQTVTTGACAEYRGSDWPHAVGEEETGGERDRRRGEGAKAFSLPPPGPSGGRCGRLVRGYYANCSDCGNKQGHRERREGLRIDCNFYKVSYKSKAQKAKAERI